MQLTQNTDTAERLMDRGEALVDIRRFVEAIPVLQSAVTTSPQSVRAWCLLALALRGAGDRTAGLKAVESSIEGDPEQEWPHRLRSIILKDLGRHKEALASAKEAVRLAPREPRALFTLASAQRTSNFKADSRMTVERLLEVAPQWGLSHQMAGLVALDALDARRAEACFRRALEVDPNSNVDLVNLGVALRRQGKKVDAIECFHNALRAEPTSSTARANLVETVEDVAGIVRRPPTRGGRSFRIGRPGAIAAGMVATRIVAAGCGNTKVDAGEIGFAFIAMVTVIAIGLIAGAGAWLIRRAMYQVKRARWWRRSDPIKRAGLDPVIVEAYWNARRHGH